MIHSVFTRRGEQITGFSLTGHAGFREHGQDIVCASVSSAALMAVNTITEIVGAKALTSQRDGYLTLRLREESDSCQVVLLGLLLHLSEIEKQYPAHLKVSLTGSHKKG